MLDMLADDRVLVRFLKRVHLPLVLVMFGPDLLGYPYPRPWGGYIQSAGIGLMCAAILYGRYLRARLSDDAAPDAGSPTPAAQ
jgi:hypothetical protein